MFQLYNNFRIYIPLPTHRSSTPVSALVVCSNAGKFFLDFYFLQEKRVAVKVRHPFSLGVFNFPADPMRPTPLPVRFLFIHPEYASSPNLPIPHPQQQQQQIRNEIQQPFPKRIISGGACFPLSLLRTEIRKKKTIRSTFSANLPTRGAKTTTEER